MLLWASVHANLGMRLTRQAAFRKTLFRG